MDNIEFTGIVFVFAVIVLMFILIKIFDRMNRVKRSRRGYDVSWIIIIVTILTVIVAGVLKRKGLI